MSSVPPSADNGYTIPLDASMTLALFQGVFTSVDSRLGGLAVKGDNWDDAVAANATELAEAMFQNSVEPHVTQLQDEITVLRASIQDAEDQLTALLSGGIQANSVTIQPITNLTATNAQAAFAEVVGVTITLSQAVTSLGQNKLDADKLGTPNGVATLDNKGFVDLPLGTIIQSRTLPNSNWLECDGAIYAQADYPELAGLIGTPGNQWFDPATPPTIPHLTGFVQRVGDRLVFPVRYSDSYVDDTWNIAWTYDGDTYTETDDLEGWFDQSIRHFGACETSAVVLIDNSSSGARSYLRDIAPDTFAGGSFKTAAVGSGYYARGLTYDGMGNWVGFFYKSANYYTAHLPESPGLTWSAMTTVTSLITNSPSLHTVGNTALLIDRHGLVLGSDDSGQTWETLRSADAAGGAAFDRNFSGPVVFGGATYFPTADGSKLALKTTTGQDWELIATPVPLRNAIADDEKIVAFEGGRYFVSDDLVTFQDRPFPHFQAAKFAFNGFLYYSTLDEAGDFDEHVRAPFGSRGYDPEIEFPVPLLDRASQPMPLPILAHYIKAKP